MPVIKIKKNQTLLDFATQHSGSAEGLYDVALLNGLSITDQPVPGTELKVDGVDDGAPLQVVSFYIKSGLDIVSIVKPVAETEDLTGIDYWALEEDFIVQ